VLDFPPVTTTADEAREFAAAFRRFLDWVQSGAAGDSQDAVVRLLREHLDDTATSVVSRAFAPFDHVNLQVALDAWSGETGREVRPWGLSRPPHFGSLDLSMLLHGEHLPPLRMASPDLVDLPVGPDRTLACWSLALLLVTDARGRYALLVRGPEPHDDPRLVVEVAGLATADAQEVLREVDGLRLSLNVYRGQVLELVAAQDGVAVAFPRLPATERADVVLPEPVLRRVERHTLEVAGRREDLRAAGQHLKRGLLLYGPPGTGKTHTARYVVQHLPGSTVLLLSGRSLHLVGQVSAMARELQPAVVVLEDVDLVAEDRGFGPGPAPVLFELLDAMDGAAEDADLLFLLTTNRADLLEPALAARPGRVDVAVEIGLPDADSRRRLLDLYARGVPGSWADEDRQRVVDRTEGVTASFVKELLRRAVLEALQDAGGPLREVRADHLDRALDDLLDATQGVTRALLGVPGDQSGPPASRGLGGHGGFGWAAPGAFGPDLPFGFGIDED
jgi:cell division protease FtsH